RPPLVPGFVLGFLLLAGANSFGLVPMALRDLLEPVVRACLLMAIGAVGLRTDLRGLMSVGITAALMLLAETVLLFLVILAAAICLPQ
ncbi:putative sulfate exporter family transporter, partial [Gemmobacter lutimaris]